jgi:D-arabinose 1-dehydrogenase-like Zn-dependent alcohol dehydrogenase
VIQRARLVQVGWDAPLAYERVPVEPLADPTHVRVAVEACGVCHRDLIDRAGRFPFMRVPVTPGHEACGRVVEVGAQVKGLAVGDAVATMHRDACGACSACAAGQVSLCEGAAWVFGILADGGYATEIAAPESAFYRVPESVPAPHAAILHCTFGTAYRDLVTLGGLRAGQRVLVTGANGGVGSAAVQIAARLGAHVVAAVRDGKHEAFVRRLGASEVVVDAGSALHDRTAPVDVALDAVGAPTFLSALRALRVGGRIVTVGNVVAEKVPLNLGFVITKGLTIVGGSGATPAEMKAVLAMHAERPFEIVIAAVVPLSRADEAQRRVRAGGLEGRIVLVPDVSGS